MSQNRYFKLILVAICTAQFFLTSYSASADIIDTPEHRRAEKFVAEIPNFRQKITSAFDIQITASCLDIIARMVAMEMDGTATPMTSAQKFEAAVMYEIVGVAYIHYGDNSVSSYLQRYENESNRNQITTRARECDSLVKSIR